MQRWYDIVRDAYGRPVAGASVNVYLSGTTTLATLYNPSDSHAIPSSTISNPVTTGADGSYGFAVTDGAYDLVVAGSNLPTQTRVHLTLADTAVTNVLTTTGDMIYMNAGAAQRLAIGSTNQVLTVIGGLPTWTTITTYDTIISAFKNKKVYTNSSLVTTTDSVAFASTPTSSNGVQSVSGTITPVYANSIIMVRVTVPTYHATTCTRQLAIFYGTGGVANTLLTVVAHADSGGFPSQLFAEYPLTVSSTSQLTFQARVFTDASGTFSANFVSSNGARNEAAVMSLEERPV